MPNLELGDLTLGDNKPENFEDKEFVWEHFPSQGMWSLLPADDDSQTTPNVLFLRLLNDEYEVDDAFEIRHKWRPLGDVKTLEEAKALCEILWRMR